MRCKSAIFTQSEDTCMGRIVPFSQIYEANQQTQISLACLDSSPHVKYREMRGPGHGSSFVHTGLLNRNYLKTPV